jgi:hypothetical protein
MVSCEPASLHELASLHAPASLHEPASPRELHISPRTAVDALIGIGLGSIE